MARTSKTSDLTASIDAARQRLELAELRNRARIENLRRRALMAHGKAISGETGARRRTQRAAYGGSAGYPDAYRGRGRDGLVPRGGSAMSHLRPQDLRNLRRASQALDRSNPIARALSARSADLIVGTGFTLQVDSGEKEWDEAVEQWWWNTAEKIGPGGLDVSGQRTFSGLVHEAVRGGCIVDGDIACLKLAGGRIQFVEAERIMNPLNGLDTDRMLGGVEVDPATGRVEAYHIAEWTPIGQAFADVNTRRVPAADVVLLRNPMRLRTGQTRGEPAMSACIGRMERLDNVAESVALGFYIASSQALFITKEDPGSDQGFAATDTETNTVDGGTDYIEDVQPGTINRLAPGEKIESPAPAQPNQSYDLLRMSEITDIAADCGLPVVLLLLDFRQVNYSSARSAVVTAWKGLARWQRHVIDTLCSPIYRWRLALAIRRGEILRKDGTPFPPGYVPANWDNHDFIAPPPPVLDVLVEMQAAELADRAKLKTKQQIYAESGNIYRDMVDRFELEDKDFKGRGLVVQNPGPNGNAAKESTSTDRADGTEVAGGKKEAA